MGLSEARGLVLFRVIRGGIGVTQRLGATATVSSTGLGRRPTLRVTKWLGEVPGGKLLAVRVRFLASIYWRVSQKPCMALESKVRDFRHAIRVILPVCRTESLDS